jgi:hypothetical protein
MKSWFMSLTGAITLSAIALLIELFRAFLDFAYILPNEFATSTELMTLTALVYVVVFGVWGRGLFAAQGGGRAGIVAALVVGALFLVAIDVGTIFFYCPGGCSLFLFNLATWAGLVLGLLAVIALAFQLRQWKAAG